MKFYLFLFLSTLANLGFIQNQTNAEQNIHFEVVFFKKNRPCVEELKFKIPQKKNLFINGSGLQAQTINVLNYEGKVEIEGFRDNLNLIEVTGPLIVGAFGSQIQVVFSKFYQAELSNISSMEGDIKIYVPDSTHANVDVVGRKIKTDLDISLGNGKKRRKTKSYQATLNEGGQKLEIYCPAGSVALLKR